MQGTVLSVDMNKDAGVLRAEDGKKYNFQFKNVLTGKAFAGSVVDFEINDDNEACEIYTKKTTLLTKLDEAFWFLFSSRGRISRDLFLVYMLGLSALVLVTAYFITIDRIPGLPAFAVTYTTYCVMVKRFHDSNSSAFWIFLLMIFGAVLALSAFNLVSFISQTGITIIGGLFLLFFAFAFYLCFAKGTKGDNKYGPEPVCCKTIKLK